MIYNPYSLEGKTVLITGASSGIGRASAIECSKLGAQVVLTGRKDNELNKTLSLMDGSNHIILRADLTKDEDVAGLVSQLPELDGLVCNAGITKRIPIKFIKRDDLYSVFDTNVFSGILLTKSIIKAKKIRNGGSIVFISSKAAHQSTPGNSVYATSKAAIECFSRGCALELAPRIRANAILPGMVETPLIHSGILSDENLAKDKERYLLKRYGTPEEIAWAIIYLLSDASAWITGTSFVIDGGCS